MRIKWVALLFVWCPLAFADDIIVCDPTHPLVPNAVSRVEVSVDPGNRWGQPGFLIWRAPNTSMTPEQIATMNQLRSQFDALQGVPRQYWICADTAPIDGLLDAVREMTQLEKDTLDAPDVAEEQRQQTFTNEVSSNTLCTAELSDLDGRVDAWVASRQAEIDAATNVAQVKAAMRGQIIPQIGTIAKKLARCVRARAR